MASGCVLPVLIHHIFITIQLKNLFSYCCDFFVDSWATEGFYLMSKQLDSTAVRESAQNYISPLKFVEAYLITQHIMSFGKCLTTFCPTIVIDRVSCLQEKEKASANSKVQTRKKCTVLHLHVVNEDIDISTWPGLMQRRMGS